MSGNFKVAAERIDDGRVPSNNLSSVRRHGSRVRARELDPMSNRRSSLSRPASNRSGWQRCATGWSWRLC